MTSLRQLGAKRSRYMVIVLAVGFALLFLRLVYLQGLGGSANARSAHLEDSATLVLLPERGQITDRHGRLLAIETTGDALYAMPRQIQNSSALSTQLAPILGKPVSWVRSALTAKLPFVWLSYHVTALQASEISALGPYNGLGLQPADWREYPQGNLAGDVLGFVGLDQQGLAGLEESYNGMLAGKPGKRVFHVDALGNPLPQLPSHTIPAVPGDNLQTTLDLTIQAFAQQDLEAAVKRWKATGGRVIVLDPATGGILAMAQTAEPAPANWQNYPMQDWVDQPVQYAYEPGSTIKPFTASAALTTGVITPQTVFNDKGHVTISGVTIYDWIPTGFGRINLNGAMAQSSDVVFSKLAMAIGVPSYFKYLHLFHLDRPTGIDLPGESGGLVPPPSQTTQLDLGEMGFGQTIAITPVQLAAAVATVADGGVWHEPHVGKALGAPGGPLKTLTFPSRRLISTAVASAVQKAMVDVVRQGTGNFAAVPGYTIAGKTGTANIPSPKGGFYKSRYLASFIGFGPVPSPRVLILVQIQDPKGGMYGGDVAAPVFAQLMGQVLKYYGVPPSQPQFQPVAFKAPKLVGKTYQEAALIASTYGLILTAQGAGAQVAVQSPAPGASILPGTTMTVTLGGQKQALGVPDVLGMTIPQAMATLRQHGYAIRVVGAGVAAHESPAPGTSPGAGQTVTVYFSAP